MAVANASPAVSAADVIPAATAAPVVAAPYPLKLLLPLLLLLLLLLQLQSMPETCLEVLCMSTVGRARFYLRRK